MDTSEIINQVCPCCGQPMEYYKQQLHPKSTRVPEWIGTCRTPDCLYQDVTLADKGWTRIVEDETFAAQYRGMNQRIMNMVRG